MKNTVKTAQSAQARSPHSRRTRPATEGKCRQTFVEAGEKRKAYPLKSGAYKLGEARRALEQQLETVKAIELIVLMKSRPHSDELLGCCVAGERASWIKSVPNSIAEIFGYLVIPGVQALSGDSVPRGRVSCLLDHARAESARIVAGCDEVLTLVRPSIEHEYTAMRRGRSLITSLLLDAVALIEAALTQAEHYELRVVRT